METPVVVLRKRLPKAIKEKDVRQKSIIRSVVSEIERTPLCDSIGSQNKVIKKMILSNNEVIKYLDSNDSRLSDLLWENAYLEEIMPRSLNIEEIKELVIEVMGDIKIAKNDGQATGIAVKFIKSKTGTPFAGEDVVEVIKEIRK